MNPNNHLQQNKGSKSPHTRIVSVQEHFFGPLPHPETLEKYNTIVPGAADRIISKFELQTDHRKKMFLFYPLKVLYEFQISFEGQHQDIPVFRFITGATLKKAVQQFCCMVFLEYCPEGSIRANH